MVTLNSQHKDSSIVKICNHFEASTNKTDSLSLTKYNRSHIVFDISNEQVGNKEYYNKLNESMIDVNCASIFYGYLLKLSLPKLNIEVDMTQLVS